MQDLQFFFLQWVCAGLQWALWRQWEDCEGHKKNIWTKSLNETKKKKNLKKKIFPPQDYKEHSDDNEKTVKDILSLASQYHKCLEDEAKMTQEQLAIKNVGKVDPRRHLQVGTLF